MCSRYELTTTFSNLPSLLKQSLPKGFEENYTPQKLIRPTDHVLVLKKEIKVSTSIMLWSFIAEWAKDPFHKGIAKPFNARAETVGEKKLFKGSWKNKRCLIPASGFFEKGHRICRIDKQTFWLGGIWNRWMSPDGSEIESCCVLTTEPNKLIKPLHSRMPVIIPNGLEDYWLDSFKNGLELKTLQSMLCGWNPKPWKSEQIIKQQTSQTSLF
ncbi:SOS response-associated peptidase [Prochlorococcus marinus]|uniref:SOS response-associated peptidase n=1 Tax=Prochlorococcus marinus TaxID=1219 RepID=UPI0022B58A01|nr:SOS response-associated peptidase [Prochlorococcus marinus]